MSKERDELEREKNKERNRTNKKNALAFGGILFGILGLVGSKLKGKKNA